MLAVARMTKPLENPDNWDGAWCAGALDCPVCTTRMVAVWPACCASLECDTCGQRIPVEPAPEPWSLPLHQVKLATERLVFAPDGVTLRGRITSARLPQRWHRTPRCRRGWCVCGVVAYLAARLGAA